MRLTITGGTGFLGRTLVAHLASIGYDCTVLTRDVARASAFGLPPGVRLAEIGEMPPADAVIHLAGENIAGFWTPRKRRAILASRLDGTRRVVAALQTAKVRPHTFLCASAVGFYGHRPGELLDETAPVDPCSSFRAVVCREWEDAANEAEASGIRVVNLRLGNVMDPAGGYLGGLLPFYRYLGGWVFGDPDAAIPWIARADAIRLIEFALANERWYGPLNIAAPNPITHREFATTLSEQLGRRFVAKAPARLLRLMFGEFASTLLDDQHVVPGKAIRAGFQYEHPRWGGFLDSLEMGNLSAGRSILQSEVQEIQSSSSKLQITSKIQ